MNAWNPYLEYEFISILKPKPMVRVRKQEKSTINLRVNYDVKPNVYERDIVNMKPLAYIRVK